MKVKSYIPFKVCRNCVYNDYKRTGVDFCIRGKCIYNIIKNETVAGQQPHKEGGKVE